MIQNSAQDTNFRVLVGFDVWLLRGGESWLYLRAGEISVRLNSFLTRLELIRYYLICGVRTEHRLCARHSSVVSLLTSHRQALC